MRDQSADDGAEIRLKQTAAGLNYIDVYHRTGEYLLSFVPGMSAAGTITMTAASLSSSAMPIPRIYD